LLGVITKIPFPLSQAGSQRHAGCSFNNRYDAINTVPKILRSGTRR